VNKNDVDRYYWRTGQHWSGGHYPLPRRVTPPVRRTSLFSLLLRGLGVMFAIGMITTLFLQINRIVARSNQPAPSSPVMRHLQLLNLRRFLFSLPTACHRRDPLPNTISASITATAAKSFRR
jgi:hypothetical protein